MKSFEIGSNSANQRLDKYLTKSFPNLPKSLMYKYIRKKRIKVNGGRAEISTRLNVGDIVELYVNDELLEVGEKTYNYDFLHASLKLDIVYEDENLIIVNKKVGQLSHPDDREFVNTLISGVKRYLYEKGEWDPDVENSFVPALINRIDRNTGGLVLAAKNADTLRIMNQKMKDRELHKYYLCVCVGIPEREEALLEDYLIKNEDKNQVYVYKSYKPGAKEIRTHYKVIRTDKSTGLSLVEVELLTGRTHQIRAHMASIDCPIFGDGKYGSNALNKGKSTGVLYKKQFLYSYKIKFDFTTESGILEYLNGKEFTAPEIWFAEQFPDF